LGEGAEGAVKTVLKAAEKKGQMTRNILEAEANLAKVT
jgi:hypothetical protein